MAGYQSYDPRSYDQRVSDFMAQQQMGMNPQYSGASYAPPAQESPSLLNSALGMGTQYGVRKGVESLFSSGGGDPVTTFGGTSGADSFSSLASTPSAEPTTISNFAGSATPYIGAAGAALGTYGAIKGVEGKNPVGAGVGALGAGLGLNAMGLALGPVGWALMAGVPIGLAAYRKFADKDRWKEEQSRRDKLAKNNVTGWAQFNATQPRLTKGRSFDSMQRKDLASDFVGLDDKGTWVNNKFNMSRNVGDLKAKDIWGYASFGEKYGNDWFGKFNEKQREDIAQMYLDSGNVTEGRGKIKLGAEGGIDEKIKNYLEGKK